ncbi:MAG: hypothetical protein IKT53_08240 [Bacteroidaceae bacterium]|nr:hypothetical protein [Bacteroidaceae bacterium]
MGLNPTLSAQNKKEEKSKFTHREFFLFILCKDARGSVGMGKANPTLSAQKRKKIQVYLRVLPFCFAIHPHLQCGCFEYQHLQCVHTYDSQQFFFKRITDAYTHSFALQTRRDTEMHMTIHYIKTRAISGDCPCFSSDSGGIQTRLYIYINGKSLIGAGFSLPP